MVLHAGDGGPGALGLWGPELGPWGPGALSWGPGLGPWGPGAGMVGAEIEDHVIEESAVASAASVLQCSHCTPV